MVWETDIVEIETPYVITYRCRTYTVLVGDHRILTVSSDTEATLSKWLNDVVKATKKNSPIIISVCAEHETQEFTKHGLKDAPYDILTLCVGSNCLIFIPPEEDAYPKSASLTHRPLRAFFENPRVIAVGMEMESLAKKLERDYGIKMKNAVDLRGMAVEGLKKAGDNLDLWRYDLDKLAKTVLGKHVDVDRPMEKLDFFDSYWPRGVEIDKVEIATVDAYISFLIGSQLYDMIHGGVADSSGKKSSKKGKNTKKAN